MKYLVKSVYPNFLLVLLLAVKPFRKLLFSPEEHVLEFELRV